MTLIYFILLIGFFAVLTPLILKKIFPHKISKNEIIATIICALIATGISIFISFGDIYNTHLVHGEITGKKKVRVSCSHSYQVCPRSSNQRHSNQRNINCITQSQHNHDYEWRVYSTIGQFNIPRADSQGLIEPHRWRIIENGQPYSKTIEYVDYIKGSHSIFNTQRFIKDSDQYFNLLPEYPEIFDTYRVNLVLSTFNINPEIRYNLNDALLDKLKKISNEKNNNTIIVVTKESQEFAEYLKRAWNNGKKNDSIVVIGVNSKYEILWSFVFGWSNNEIFNINLRNSINDIDNLSDYETIANVIQREVHYNFDKKNIDEFKYLIYDRQVSTTSMLLILILQFIFNVCVSIIFTFKNKTNKQT